MFDMTGATREYVDMDIDFDGVEYTGPTTLLEYVVGEMMLKNMGNASDSTYAGNNISIIWYLNDLVTFPRYEGVTSSVSEVVLSRGVRVPPVSPAPGGGLHHLLLQSGQLSGQDDGHHHLHVSTEGHDLCYSVSTFTGLLWQTSSQVWARAFQKLHTLRNFSFF